MDSVSSNKKREPAPKNTPQRKRGRPAAMRAKRQRQQRVLSVVGVVLLVCVAVGAFVLISSGDDAVDPSVASSSLRFEATDFAYSPDVIHGLAGDIDVELVNDGPGAHDLVILAQGVHITSGEEYDPADSVGTIPWTAPRAESAATFNLEPGVYQIVCTLPGHLEDGMEAELIVE